LLKSGFLKTLIIKSKKKVDEKIVSVINIDVKFILRKKIYFRTFIVKSYTNLQKYRIKGKTYVFTFLTTEFCVKTLRNAKY